MPIDREPTKELAQALAELAELRRFSSAPKEFWPRLLVALASLAGASKANLLLKDNPPSEQSPAKLTEGASIAPKPEVSRWKLIGDWPANAPPSRLTSLFASRLEEFANRCQETGFVIVSLDGASPRNSGQFAVGVKQKLLSEQACVAAFLLSEVNEPVAREALLRLELAADVPRSYQEFMAGEKAKSDILSFAAALDLMTGVNAEKRFLAAALAFCNGLAGRFGADRVSLGWLQAGYVRLKAISRTEKFNRQMGAAQALEAAMDECLDQDEEILWPVPDGNSSVVRDHERFSRDQKVAYLCSLPLRLDRQPVAVLTCERDTAPFTSLELQQLRLCCDQAGRRLADLHRRDRWFGARWAAWWKDQCAVIVGPKHTWAKVTSLLIAILLAALFFVRLPYRVEGNFVLKSDQIQFRTAPFDGYIEQVFVRPGDTVKADDKLLKLVTRELELEESAALAELARFQREAEKARATNGLAEMRVALALADQSTARLDLVRHRLKEATLKAPFDGVIVEGDLRERLAAPVKQGDALMKIARIENLYVEAEVNERDIHELLRKPGLAALQRTSADRAAAETAQGKTVAQKPSGQQLSTNLISVLPRGEIAFVSQPRLKFPIRVVKLDPAAFPRTEGNVFLVRCEFEKSIEKWWRPGMSGLCKLNVEPRTLWWILTHRTVDFLRMKLWW